MKNIFELEIYRVIEKVQETSLNTGMRKKAITVLHEQ